MDLGVSEFVAKPVNNKDLLARVRTQLRTHEWQKDSDRAFSELGRSPLSDMKKEDRSV